MEEQKELCDCSCQNSGCVLLVEVKNTKICCVELERKLIVHELTFLHEQLKKVLAEGDDFLKSYYQKRLLDLESEAQLHFPNLFATGLLRVHTSF
ncbi:MAG: hypothetical protein LBD57_04080 [Endomicrobium sp.]|jgi:hypothetical protein|uniref:hypothetical protein n=1 Tax=Candidatus Endomicrobiellum cubanum TaxID=3242325 RepID=UPI00281ECD3E|nr:hypothetical protein [Endomicrobium sp.]